MQNVPTEELVQYRDELDEKIQSYMKGKSKYHVPNREIENLIIVHIGIVGELTYRERMGF